MWLLVVQPAIVNNQCLVSKPIDLSYFVDGACFTWCRGSLITWTPWTIYYLTIILLILIPVPTFLPVYTHNVSKTMHVFCLCIPPVEESAAGHLDWNFSPWGDKEVFFYCEVWKSPFISVGDCIIRKILSLHLTLMSGALIFLGKCHVQTCSFVMMKKSFCSNTVGQICSQPVCGRETAMPQSNEINCSFLAPSAVCSPL